ncbi:uncharacterized protein LOC121864867, partial [Homarus americanus]|uniref:uncharacterized protein LOC121864867 n=1 Tax=Homarus americanus TaxID=6706 RepID=UPI001C45089C
MFTFDDAKVVRLVPINHPSRKELNLLVLRKFFDSSGITGVTRVVRSVSGDLTVTFAEWGGARQLRHIKEINGIKIKLKWNYIDNSVFGVISHTEIEYLEGEEIFELIEDEILFVRKLTSTTALVGFPKELPSSVLLGWEKIPVKPYQKKPTRCYNCQKYGHLARKCRAREVCSSCGTPGQCGHIDADCQAAAKKCAACGGPHSSSDRECPKWREECRVAKL